MKFLQEFSIRVKYYLSPWNSTFWFPPFILKNHNKIKSLILSVFLHFLSNSYLFLLYTLCYHRNFVLMSWANYRAKHQLENKISVCRLLKQMVFIARARFTYWFDSQCNFFFFYETQKCSDVFAGTCHDRRETYFYYFAYKT